MSAKEVYSGKVDVSLIPFPERLSQVEAIQATIPLDSIKIQRIKGKITEIWGLVCVEGLPFVFRAFPAPGKQPIKFLQNGSLREQPQTNWFPTAPHNPLKFREPVSTEPMSEKLLEEKRLQKRNDTIYVLKNLGVVLEDVEQVGDKELDSLYRTTLQLRQEDYESFERKYLENPLLMMAFGAAVSRACNAHKESLILRSQNVE